MASNSNWRGGRAVEGARLESVYTATPYRGFDKMRQHFRDAGASATAPFRVSDRQGANPSLPLQHLEKPFFKMLVAAPARFSPAIYNRSDILFKDYKNRL